MPDYPLHKREHFNRLRDFCQAEGSKSSLQTTLRLPWGTETLQSILSSPRSLSYLTWLLQRWEEEPKAVHHLMLDLLGLRRFHPHPGRIRKGNRRATRSGAGAPGTKKTPTGAEHHPTEEMTPWQ